MTITDDGGIIGAMKLRILLLMILFLPSISGFLCGCAITHQKLDVIYSTHPNEVKSQVFTSSLGDVYNVTKKVCSDLLLSIQRVDQGDENIKIYAGTPPVGIGFNKISLELIGIYLTKIEERQTKTEVLTKPIDPLGKIRGKYKNISETILNMIELELKE